MAYSLTSGVDHFGQRVFFLLVHSLNKPEGILLVKGLE